MKILFCDTETYSHVDITTAGTVKYAESATMLLAGFLLGDKYAEYDIDLEPVIPDWVINHISSGGKVCAHNALFDYLILRKHIPILSLDQMIDTAAMCGAAGIPLSLEKAGNAINMPQDKKKLTSGKKLIKVFSIPNDKGMRNTVHDYPGKWDEFKEYLYNDIQAMIYLYNHLPKLSDSEQQVWVDTQIVNLEGIPVDVETTKLILSQIDDLVNEESTNFIRLTGVFPTQRDKVLDWCRAQGAVLANLQAATVEQAILSEKTPQIVREALEHRANTAHASFKKYPTILAAAMDDNKVRGTLMYHVAQTGRFGGRLLQPHNLTKGPIKGSEAVQRIKDGEFSVDLVKSALRSMIWEPEGMTIADYAGIEARISQWLARDEDALQVFRDKLDPYKWMAQKIYGVGYDEVTSKQRFAGKQAILGLGYAMGGKKFKAVVEGYGEEITLEEANFIVQTYRDTHPKLVSFWSTMNDAALEAMQLPRQQVRANKYVSFIYQPPFLFMYLPSGRRLTYYRPTITQDGYKYALSYMGVNSQSQFVEIRTYGGKLVENAVQGIARDILTEAIRRLISRGYTVLFHVHDEIIVKGYHNLESIYDIMCELPKWAEGLPLDADGATSERFMKL